VVRSISLRGTVRKESRDCWVPCAKRPEIRLVKQYRMTLRGPADNALRYCCSPAVYALPWAACRSALLPALPGICTASGCCLAALERV
jgi:hypothetical protein